MQETESSLRGIALSRGGQFVVSDIYKPQTIVLFASDFLFEHFPMKGFYIFV